MASSMTKVTGIGCRPLLFADPDVLPIKSAPCINSNIAGAAYIIKVEISPVSKNSQLLKRALYLCVKSLMAAISVSLKL